MALWTPNDLVVKPQLWFDAQDSATITHSAGVVSSWKNKGPYGGNATQATNTLRPFYNPTGFDGVLPSINVDQASPDWLAINWNHTGNLLSVFVVVDVDDPLTYSGRIISMSSAINTEDYIETAYQLYVETGDPAFGAYGRGDELILSASDHGPHIHYGAQGITLNSYIIDGGTSVTGTTLVNTPHNIGYVRIGCSSSSAEAVTAKFAEILVFIYEPSTPVVQQIRGYLAHKWNIAYLLPAGDPYKTTAPQGPAFSDAFSNAFDTGPFGVAYQESLTFVSKSVSLPLSLQHLFSPLNFRSGSSKLVVPRTDFKPAASLSVGSSKLVVPRTDFKPAASLSVGSSKLAASRGDFKSTALFGSNALNLVVARGDFRSITSLSVGSSKLVVSRGDFRSAVSFGSNALKLPVSKVDYRSNISSFGSNALKIVVSKADFRSSTLFGSNTLQFPATKADFKSDILVGVNALKSPTSKGDFKSAIPFGVGSFNLVDLKSDSDLDVSFEVASSKSTSSKVDFGSSVPFGVGSSKLSIAKMEFSPTVSFGVASLKLGAVRFDFKSNTLFGVGSSQLAASKGDFRSVAPFGVGAHASFLALGSFLAAVSAFVRPTLALSSMAAQGVSAGFSSVSLKTLLSALTSTRGINLLSSGSQSFLPVTLFAAPVALSSGGRISPSSKLDIQNVVSLNSGSDASHFIDGGAMSETGTFSASSFASALTHQSAGVPLNFVSKALNSFIANISTQDFSIFSSKGGLFSATLHGLKSDVSFMNNADLSVSLADRQIIESASFLTSSLLSKLPTVKYNLTLLFNASSRQTVLSLLNSSDTINLQAKGVHQHNASLKIEKSITLDANPIIESDRFQIFLNEVDFSTNAVINFSSQLSSNKSIVIQGLLRFSLSDRLMLEESFIEAVKSFVESALASLEPAITTITVSGEVADENIALFGEMKKGYELTGTIEINNDLHGEVIIEIDSK